MYDTTTIFDNRNTAQEKYMDCNGSCLLNEQLRCDHSHPCTQCAVPIINAIYLIQKNEEKQ